MDIGAGGFAAALRAAAKPQTLAINYAPDGRIVGIEVLDASEYVFPTRERRIVVQNVEVVTTQ